MIASVVNVAEYANLQMAAEALLEGANGTLTFKGLVEGNNRASKFPEALATRLIDYGWTIVERSTDGHSGFSGTLFRNEKTKEHVLSFRSTEFIDDAARDNQATNSMEIQPFGFAFGQIADMERWYGQLRTGGALPEGTEFTVTGYSLGGHLAAAFNWIRAEEQRALNIPNPIRQTFTFNGAGVGNVQSPSGLKNAVEQFNAWSTRNQRDYFSTDEAREIYERIRNTFNGTASPERRQLESLEIFARLSAMGPENKIAEPNRILYKELKQLFTAADRSLKISEVAVAVPKLSSGATGVGSPARVGLEAIAALSLDYQLAVLRASEMTTAFKSGIIDGLELAYASDRAPLTVPGIDANSFYDVYAAPPPSAIANSQHHLGRPVPVFVEDQPLHRGNFGAEVLVQSNVRLLAGEVRLLADNFVRNDFGDNHSLVLLIDSLEVQALLASLDARVDASSLDSIMQSGSNLKGESVLFRQGKAEGDALENVLDGLRRTLLGPEVAATPANLDGGTWADVSARNEFYEHLSQLTQGGNTSAIGQLTGLVQVRATYGDSDLALRAKSDFASLLALLTLSPLSLSSKGPAAAEQVETFLARAWPVEYAEWKAGAYSHQFLADRQALLDAINGRNVKNQAGNGLLQRWRSDQTIFRDLDANSGQRWMHVYGQGLPPVGSDYIRHVIFGGRGAQEIIGKELDDRLYGGIDNDIIKGGGRSDYLEGNEGSDSLEGGTGADTLYGGSGRDTLIGDAGDDLLCGGVGADLYIVGANSGFDTIISGDGADQLEMSGRVLSGSGTLRVMSDDGSRVWIDDSVLASPISYSYDATSRELTVRGQGSAVLVKEFAGGDLGIAMPGEAPHARTRPQATPAPSRQTTSAFYNDVHTIVDAEGRSETATSAIGDYGEVRGDGVLVGNDSSNLLQGGGGADWLLGAGGRDVLIGGDGSDTISGDADADALSGGIGDDSLDGGLGDDVITGGIGNDTVLGGAGHDVILAGASASAFVNDWQVVRRGLIVELAGFDGGPFYAADDGRDLVDAGAGDDLVWGGESDDTLLGGAGADFLDGQMGDDELRGGADDDLISGDGSQSSQPDFFTLESFHGRDTLYGGAGHDRLQGDGLSDTLFGDAGDDTLWGDASGGGIGLAYIGNDRLDGGEGDDLLVGNAGEDTLLGGNGNDDLHGDDRFDASAHGRDSLDGGDGNDTLSGDGQGDLLNGGVGDDQLFGDADDVDVAQRGDDTLYGDAGNDYLRGYEGHDVLDGGSGSDRLLGEAGSDTLCGGTGDDSLDGGAGDDVLVGGAGVDLLIGGEGDDVYVMEPRDPAPGDGQAVDTIVDNGGRNRIVIADGSVNDVDARVDTGDLHVYAAGSAFAVADAFGTGSFEFELLEGSRYSMARFLGSFTTAGARGDGFSLGGSADERIEALGGRSVVSGGCGDDTLIGSGGSNTYLYSSGDGRDLIRDSGPKSDGVGVTTPNRLVIEDGYDASAVQLSVGTGANGGDAGDLVLRFGHGGDTIGIGGFRPGDALAAPQIDTFTFADGVTLSYADMLARGFDIIGTSTSEQLTGTNLVDRFAASEGDDTMSGGAGADTYFFDLGSGFDVVEETATGAPAVDTIAIGGGLVAQDLILNRSGDDLSIRVRDGFDRLLIRQHFAGARVERITFVDGSVWEGAILDAHLTNELTDGADAYTGSSNADVIDGRAGADTLQGMGGADVIDGGSGQDWLDGADGADALYGGDDDDTLVGGEGDDQLHGDAGNDVLRGGSGDDRLDGGSGDDTYATSAGIDTFTFGYGAGRDRIDFAAWPGSSQVVRFGPGISPADLRFTAGSYGADIGIDLVGASDSLTISDFFARALNPSHVDQLRFEFDNATVWDGARVVQQVYAGTPGNDRLNAIATGSSISGGDGNDQISGNVGNDTLDGGSGQDTLSGGGGADLLIDGETMDGGTGDDIFVVSAWAAASTPVLRDGGGRDAVLLPQGCTASQVGTSNTADDGLLLSYRLPNGTMSAMLLEGYFAGPSDQRIEEIRFGDGAVWSVDDVAARVRAERLTEGPDVPAYGFGWDDVMDGKGGNDLLDGRGGKDVVDGGAGNDTVYGNSGDDTVLGGTGDDTLYGDDFWATTRGNDRLDGGPGSDALAGGLGDDVYVFGRAADNDTVTETDGYDRIVLEAGVTAYSVTLHNDSNDLVIVLDGSRTQMRVAGHFELASRQIEAIDFADGSSWDARSIASMAVGSGTADTLVGTSGNDSFLVDSRWDVVLDTNAQDSDTVSSSTGYRLPANVENLTLTGLLNIDGYGNSGTNLIIGNAADNRLHSDYGRDTLRGGAGNDTYDLTGAFAQAGHPSAVTVIELPGEGLDTVRVDNYDYELPANVENLVAPSTMLEKYDGQGMPIARQLIGNAGNNIIDASLEIYAPARLDGGPGADTLIGSEAANIYVVDNTEDVPLEPLNIGSIDTIETSIDWSLAEAFENLKLVGSAAITGTGNAGANVLDGSANAAANRLIGGAGSDTYVLGVGDAAIEEAGQGNDTVVLATSTTGRYFIGDFAHVEGLILDLGMGASTLVGGTGSDTLVGNGSYSMLEGRAGDDVLADQSAKPFPGRQFLEENPDTLLGGDGDDFLLSRSGQDRLHGGAGRDVIQVDGYAAPYPNVAAVIRFEAGDGEDCVTGTRSVAISVGGWTLSDLWTSRPGSDLVLRFGNGADSLTIAGATRVVELLFDDGTVVGADGLASLAINQGRGPGTDGADFLIGTNGADVLVGAGGDDTIHAGAGDDLVEGGDGLGLLYGGDGQDTLRGGAAGDTIYGGAGHDVVDLAEGADGNQAWGGTGNDSIFGGAGADVLWGEDGDDELHGGAGDDQLTGGAGNDVLLGEGGLDVLGGGDGADILVGANGDGGAGNDILTGTQAADRLNGGSDDDLLNGAEGNDVLRGDAGADTLAGGAGNDLLDGNAGDDVYRFGRGDGADTIVSVYGDGSVDELQFGTGITPGDIVATRTGTVDLCLSVRGTTDAVLVTGFMNWGAPLAQVRFSDGSLWDRDRLFTELATVRGTAGADSLTGTSDANLLIGLEGNDTLSGLDGEDTLDGGAGSDRLLGGNHGDLYIVDSAADVVVEYVNQGWDTVRSGISFTLPTNVEVVELVGTTAIDATGNSANNELVGNAENNVLAGGAGDDRLFGGEGNDTLNGGTGSDFMAGGRGDDSYVVDGTPVYDEFGLLSGDEVLEAPHEGMDSVSSSGSYELPVDVENLTLTGTANLAGKGNDQANALTGNGGANLLEGRAGRDTLNGGAGNDTLVGGADDDSYVVDATADIVTELAGEGVDLVSASVTYTLPAHVEQLTLSGSSTINATGNALDNVLTGNVGANRLNGGSGADTMLGGAGDDIYVVDGASDVVVELAGGGIDTVESVVGWTLDAEFENLTLTGSAAVDGTGNAFANKLTGNAAANRLDGRSGQDTMIGGAGHDTYVVDSTADIVTEAVGGGTDTVESSVNWTLGAEVENVTLTGSANLNGTGNGLANRLIGNAGSNVLDGGAGTDTLAGGDGDDVYYVDTATDVVTETPAGGIDTVHSSVTFTLASNIEHLVLTGTGASSGTGNALANSLVGNGANNTLRGADGHDTLDGGLGTDTMIGGAGDDIYVVNVSTDLVTEDVSAGTDTIRTSVTIATLAANVENAVLIGSSAINVSGNTLANSLLGNSGNNALKGGEGNDTLDGGLGIDTLEGGLGDDSYLVDTTTDVITEASGGGVDTVVASVSYALGANLEHLGLTGSAAVNGTGNVAANRISGNAGNNVLIGGAGNDTLDGAGGSDQLDGGMGADVYRFGAGYGVDSVSDNDTTAGVVDALEFVGPVTPSSVQFAKVGNDLEVRIIGASDKAVVRNWYLGNAYKLEQIRFSDGSTMTAGQVESAAAASSMQTVRSHGNTTTSAMPSIAASSSGTATPHDDPVASIDAPPHGLLGRIAAWRARGEHVAQTDRVGGHVHTTRTSWRMHRQLELPAGHVVDRRDVGITHGRSLNSADLALQERQVASLVDAMAGFSSTIVATPLVASPAHHMALDRLVVPSLQQ